LSMYSFKGYWKIF